MAGYSKSGREQVIGGIVLILIGTLFLMDRVWFFDFGRMIGRYWPLLLIGIGVVQLLNERTKSWVGPLTLVVLGAIFQVQRIELFDRWNLSWRNLWPLMLIGIGFALLIDRLRLMGRREPASFPPGGSGSDSPQHTPLA